MLNHIGCLHSVERRVERPRLTASKISSTPAKKSSFREKVVPGIVESLTTMSRSKRDRYLFRNTQIDIVMQQDCRPLLPETRHQLQAKAERDATVSGKKKDKIGAKSKMPEHYQGPLTADEKDELR